MFHYFFKIHYFFILFFLLLGIIPDIFATQKNKHINRGFRSFLIINFELFKKKNTLFKYIFKKMNCLRKKSDSTLNSTTKNEDEETKSTSISPLERKKPLLNKKRFYHQAGEFYIYFQN